MRPASGTPPVIFNLSILIGCSELPHSRLSFKDKFAAHKSLLHLKGIVEDNEVGWSAGFDTAKGSQAKRVGWVCGKPEDGFLKSGTGPFQQVAECGVLGEGAARQTSLCIAASAMAHLYGPAP